MEDNQNSVSDANQSEGSAQTEKNQVAYETYRKTVGEVKKLKSELDSFKQKEVEREQALLAEQGKYKEALEAAVKKQKELEKSLQEKEKAYARNIFTKEAKSVAMQLGAMPEALDDIVKVGNWADVEIDEKFEINSDQLKEAIVRLQKEKPFYFRKDSSSPRTVSSNASGMAAKKDNKELSKDEIIAKLKSLA
jgi:hypothetical protein